MLLIKGLQLTPFDDSRWVVSTNEGRNFLINEPTTKLVTILSRAKNEEDAYLTFKSQFNRSIVFEDFIQLVKEKLGGYHILQNDTEAEKPPMLNPYLKLKLELINAQWANWLSKPLQIFFTTSVFWYAFAASIVFLCATFFTFPIGFTNINFPLLTGLFYSTMLIHELGHIGACARCKIKHGGIGFGFYFILPVMYADITNIWLANKEQRLIGNMGGIFAEIFYSALLVIVYLLTGEETFLTAAFSISTFVVWEFNPFVRFDGYWLLSDLTNTPNLIHKSGLVLKKVFNIKNIIDWKNTGFRLQFAQRDVLLFIYGTINMSLIFGIMAYTIFTYREALLTFHLVVFDLIKKALNFNLSFSDFKYQFITLGVFYTLALRLSIKYGKALYGKIIH
jgi:putative peptide zinc metalloprotease protein